MYLNTIINHTPTTYPALCTQWDHQHYQVECQLLSNSQFGGGEISAKEEFHKMEHVLRNTARITRTQKD